MARHHGPPLSERGFRWLLAIFVANGIAAAVPASLVLFFVADRLQMEHQSGVLLALYFVAAAFSMPMWARLAHRWGLHATWLAGMALAIGTFVWAYAVGPGDFVAFALVCTLSGIGLGADLALPPALLARVRSAAVGTRRRARGRVLRPLELRQQDEPRAGRRAGVAGARGRSAMRPGARDATALDALAFAYAVLPCLLKLAAAALLIVAWRGQRC